MFQVLKSDGLNFDYASSFAVAAASVNFGKHYIAHKLITNENKCCFQKMLSITEKEEIDK